MGCQGREPGETEGQTAGKPAEEQGSEAHGQEPQTSSEPGQSEEPGSSLPITQSDIVGQWEAMAEPDTPAGYFYAFDADGTFAIYEGSLDNRIMAGDYRVVEEHSVRMEVSETGTDAQQAVVTLLLQAKRGSNDLVFTVSPGGETLWLARMENETNGKQ